MWDNWTKVVVFWAPFLLLLMGLAVWMFLRKTIRTRLRMVNQLNEDPDIDEWLVVFDWSRKVLYFPTILMSLLACGLMLLKNGTGWSWPDDRLIGGLWLAVFFINFLVDEYEVSVKVLLIWILCAMATLLWLSLMGWVGPFMRFFKHLSFRMDAVGYLMLAVVFAMAIVLSWLKGMFYYIAITPNYMNIQVGPTETGEQISREEYSTRIDTGDFLERLFGFGRIVVTFRDQRRQPRMFLVNRIGKRAQRLESIRGKLAVDRHEAASAQETPPLG